MTERPASVVLDDCYLEARAKLLEVAAIFDRIDRGDEELSGAAADRRGQLDEAAQLLLESGDDRASRLQMLFSREYDPDWRSSMNV
jgi:hypothetical protein